MNPLLGFRDRRELRPVESSEVGQAASSEQFSFDPEVTKTSAVSESNR